MAMKKCKECGEEISSSAKECPKCGKKQKPSGCLIAVIVVILLIIIACAGGSNNNSTPTVTNSSSTQEETIYNIGDTIQNGNYEITISSVKETSKVGNQYLNSQPAEGGTYVCVDLSYKNISNEPLSSWKFPTLKLIDLNGVEYSYDISASSYYATETDPDRKVLSDLNPGITTKDSKVFEISKESYSQEEWFVLIDNKLKVKIK